MGELEGAVINKTMKKETISFLWKLFTSLIAAIGTAIGVSSCVAM